MAIVVVLLVVLAVWGGKAVIAQDTGQAKYTVRVPNGLAFSEFRGYESWQTVSVSQGERLAVIAASPDAQASPDRLGFGRSVMASRTPGMGCETRG